MVTKTTEAKIIRLMSFNMILPAQMGQGSEWEWREGLGYLRERYSGQGTVTSVFCTARVVHVSKS